MIHKLTNLMKIFFVTLIFYLLCDFIFGKKILETFYWKDKDNFRIEHPVYYNTIISNYNDFAYFGGTRYKMCSDASGFKSSCNMVNKKNKIFDIAFIGDSFTEGIGVPYEDTFVGIISNKLNDKKIANLAVVGYSTSIYYIKIKHLLENNYNFKEVIIYIDLNDIWNEANAFKIVDNKVIALKEKKKTINYLINDSKEKYNLKMFFRKYLMFTYENLHLIKMYYYRLSNKSVFPYVVDLNMAAWPYDQNVEDYGDLGVEKSIDKAKLSISKLMDLLDKNGIEYSIGVYPYPQSMFHDQVNSRHVKIWKDMCENRCKYFFNNFTKFFEISKKIGPIETYYKYYIYRDAHFNSAGHRLIAENFLSEYNN